MKVFPDDRKETVMKKTAWLMTGLIVLLLGCSSGPGKSEKLIGKWVPVSASDMQAWGQFLDGKAELEIEFTPDGMVKMFMSHGGSYFILTAAYQVTDKNTMKISSIKKEEDDLYIPGTEADKPPPATPKSKVGFWGMTLAVYVQEFEFSFKGDNELIMSRIVEENEKPVKKAARFVRLR